MIELRDDWHDASQWDAFVEHHAEARFCHLYGYASVLECYGYARRNIAFLKNREIVAVLPAVRATSLLFGRRLVSQPFSEYGGLLIDANADEDDAAEILDALKRYGREHGALIEMHGNHGVPEPWREGWASASLPHHVAVLSLDRSPERLWEEVVRYSVRKAVNQARSFGLEVACECDEKIIKSQFFPLYLQSMKRLGSPPHTIDYYLACYRVFGERMRIVWAKKDGASVAGLLGFSCAGRVNITNTVSDPGQWHLRGNDLVHWEFIKWARDAGHTLFDFGSVRYQGQRDYKKKWGCSFLEHNYYHLAPNEDAQTAVLDSSSQSMQTMADLWSRYMPIMAGRQLGPIIRKHLIR
jgi:hypothetical protein